MVQRQGVRMPSSIAFLAELDEIASGERTPERAWTTLRAWVETSPPDLGRRMYLVLKAVTLGQLTGRRRTELTAWVEIIRNASALLRTRKQQAIAERVSALADLTADWGRKLDVIAPETLLNRPHVGRLLQALERRQGPMPREELRREVGIGTANLSRVLGSMEAAGLVRRESCSRSTTVEITAEGRLRMSQAASVNASSTVTERQLNATPPARTVADMVAAFASGRRSKGSAAVYLPMDKMRVATLHNGQFELVGHVVLESTIDKHVLETSQGLTVLAETSKGCVVLNSDVPGPSLISGVELKKVLKARPAAELSTASPRLQQAS